ncbi:MAG TPA: thioesterase family protein [Solirubrobacteraceae bacterium]|jgi:acyl-CoA thioesterase|nr:thioesterase family protein [Solirubrobacteraceae bacterium]
MASDLELATRVQRERGGYTATLSDQWEIWGPNGGYLAAIALRAVGEETEIRRPRSFYCHFLSSPAFAPVHVGVSALKRGRRAESFSVTMSQEGKPVLHALVKTAADAPGYEHQHPQAPSVPPPERVETYEWKPAPGEPSFRFWENIQRRPVPRDRDDRAPLVREWTRFQPTACFEDPFVDAARLLILLDTFGFPAAYRHYRSWEYLAPNLDTALWLHRFSPDCEWLLIDHRCTVAEHGLMGVDGRVWDTDGRLLASGAAQLCCLPGPSG